MCSSEPHIQKKRQLYRCIESSSHPFLGTQNVFRTCSKLIHTGLIYLNYTLEHRSSTSFLQLALSQGLKLCCGFPYPAFDVSVCATVSVHNTSQVCELLHAFYVTTPQLDAILVHVICSHSPADLQTKSCSRLIQ